MSTLHRNRSIGAPFWTGASAIPPWSGPDASGAARWLRGAHATVRLWQKRSRDRQELLDLDDHVLRDIGLTRYEVAMEARKPFWRA